jgi:hypothetical protein
MQGDELAAADLMPFIVFAEIWPQSGTDYPEQHTPPAEETA